MCTPVLHAENHSQHRSHLCLLSDATSRIELLKESAALLVRKVMTRTPYYPQSQPPTRGLQRNELGLHPRQGHDAVAVSIPEPGGAQPVLVLAPIDRCDVERMADEANEAMCCAEAMKRRSPSIKAPMRARIFASEGSERRSSLRPPWSVR